MQLNVLDTDVSLFKSARAPQKLKDVNLLSYLSTPNSSYIAMMEKVRAEKVKTLQKSLKMNMPGITVSGTFSYRSDKRLLKHSGLISIDIDKDDNTHIVNFCDLRRELANIDCVAYCGLSVRGEGYFCLIPIEHPDNHKVHFEALKKDFAAYNIIIDPSCGDISRLRFYSYDAKAHINPFAEIYNKTPVLSTSDRTRATIRQEWAANVAGGGVSDIVDDLVNQIEHKQVDITQNYRDWFFIGNDLASTLGEQGRLYFHRISCYHPGYSPSKCEYQFDACMKYVSERAPSLKTLLEMCSIYAIYTKAPGHQVTKHGA